MSCRTTPAGSAFTSYARLANFGMLSDVATLGTFHWLRSRYQDRDEATRRQYTDAEYRDLLTRQLARTARANGLDETRRASITARLQAALADPATPDQGTLYALFNLNPTVRDRGTNLTNLLSAHARTLGLSLAEIRTAFREAENSIDRSRGAAAPETFTEANRALAAQRGLPLDAGTVHAMAVLDARIDAHRAQIAENGPQRITRTVEPSPRPYQGFTVLEHGYDARNQRLEVVVENTATGERTTHAYRGVNADAYRSAADAGTTAEFWFDSVRGNSDHAYSSRLEAALDSAAPRCSVCGQFADQHHTCPAIATPRAMTVTSTSSRWSTQSVTAVGFTRDGQETTREVGVRLPAIREFRTAVAAGPVSVDINDGNSEWNEQGAWEWSYQRGTLTVFHHPDTGALVYNTAAVRCSCRRFNAEGTCVHIDRIASAARARLEPAARVPAARLTPEQRAERLAEAQAIAETAARTDWTRNEATLAEARRTWRTDAEVVYSQDTAAFMEAFTAAKEARTAANGQTVVPLIRENALDGMAQRGSGQGFGMEIEYEFPATMSYSERRDANERIGRALYAASLTYDSRQVGYGASRTRGFRDTHTDANGVGNWSWERDGSVNGGELVTPVMYDEPETWAKLEQAVQILRDNGAVPSRRAGAHVHVGTAMYTGDPAKYAELARLMVQHEDVMLRLAADPERGTHRNSSYAAPLREVPADGFADISSARTWQGGRTKVLNFNGVNSPVTVTTRDARGRETQMQDASYLRDHPEFRIFDSTLHAGTMQAQIKLAVAMTHAAARNADLGGTTRTREAAGSHARRVKARGRRQPTEAELLEETATFRSLLDTLFRRKQDKDQLVSLFAHTKWLANPQGGYQG